MYCFFSVFVSVAIVVATAPYFDLKWHSVMTYWQIQNVFVYCATTGYYEDVPVLLRGTFYTYSISAMKLLSFNADVKNYEYFVIWKLIEANIISAWIIIASWTYC